MENKETGERESLKFKVSLGFAKKIRKLQKKGFDLVDVEGRGAIADYARRQLQDYNANPKDYRLSSKDLWTTTTQVTGQTAKEIKQKAIAVTKSAAKGAIKKPFRRLKQKLRGKPIGEEAS